MPAFLLGMRKWSGGGLTIRKAGRQEEREKLGTGAPKCAGYATEGLGLFRVGAIAREHRIDRRVLVFGRRDGPQVAGPYGRWQLHRMGQGTAECAGYAEEEQIQTTVQRSVAATLRRASTN